MLARRAAYMSVYTDLRLLGMPKSRVTVVRFATAMALGRDTGGYAEWIDDLELENRDVALEAVHDARQAAADVVVGLQDLAD